MPRPHPAAHRPGRRATGAAPGAGHNGRVEPLWAGWPIGTRVVIRYRRPEGGFADALGDLVEADDESAVVLTRRGEVRVDAAAAVIGKPVPPPPPRRRPRRQES